MESDDETMALGRPQAGERKVGRPSTALERGCASPGCEARFPVKPSVLARGGGLYCSAACRGRARAAAASEAAKTGGNGTWMERTCENPRCGKPFRFLRSQEENLLFGTRRHCSVSCRREARMAGLAEAWASSGTGSAKDR
jgi:hypothetical protein